MFQLNCLCFKYDDGAISGFNLPLLVLGNKLFQTVR